MRKHDDKIYMEYSILVKHFLFSLTNDYELSEDLTQETFYQAYKSIHRYNGDCKFSVWLCQIAKHLYFDYLKKKTKVKSIQLEDLEYILPETTSEYNPEAICLTNEKIAGIANIIRTVKPPYGQIFLLRHMNEMSYKEIGEIFEKSENWARVTYYRAKNMIKERMIEDELHL